MQRNILSGSEFLLYNIDNEPVAYCTNSVLKINNNLSDITTKDSESWTEYMVGLKDWSIDFDGLVSYDNGFDTSFFLSKFKSGDPFFIRFGVVQENFTHAFSGEVNIQSIDQSADNGEIVTYSGSLKGVGELAFTDEGTPIQNGYLKTETDPVFRRSPSFNITDEDKLNWNNANSKIVQELEFLEETEKTTLKIKFKDGTFYTSSFKPVKPIIDLSGYYTKSENDQKVAIAQVAADNANSLLNAIASDAKLTPSEKQNVLKEWLIIQDENPKLTLQANIFQVETLDYDVAFIELDQYLEPLLLSMITTDNIEGYQFRGKFRNYYDEKILLLKSISEASKSYTDEEIEAITIGSRNYHLKGDKTIIISSTENQILQSGNYPINAQLAISFFAKSIDGSNRLFLEFDNSESKEFTISGDWIRYTALLKTTDNPILNARVGATTSVMNMRAISSTSGGFPYSFPFAFGTRLPSTGIEMKNIMVVQGTKPVDFVPAPEDYYDLINKAKSDAQVAANLFSQAQRELAEINANAYADGIVTDLEQVLIDNGTGNLAAAKAYSDAQDLRLKTLTDAYADGKITLEEQARINAVQANLTAAKAYTEAQRVLSETIIKAYADGVVDAEEARAIADATAKLNTAKAYADSTALALKTELTDYIDQSILDKANELIANTTSQIDVANTAVLQHAKSDAESKIAIAQEFALNSANAFTTAQRLLAETTAQAYADGIITLEEQARIDQANTNLQVAKEDATAKANTAAQYGIVAQQLHNALIGNLKSLAYSDVIEVAKLGDTIVQGGFLKTSLLDVNYIKAGIINADYINSLEIITNSLKTSINGKRVEILGSENNIKLLDNNDKSLVTIDDDSALEGGYYETTNPPPVSIPPGLVDPNYMGMFNRNGVNYHRYANVGPGISVGSGALDSNGFSTIGRKGIQTTGEVKSGLVDTATSSMKSTGFTTTGAVDASGKITGGNLKSNGKIEVVEGSTTYQGINLEQDIRVGGDQFKRFKWVNGILVSITNV